MHGIKIYIWYIFGQNINSIIWWLLNRFSIFDINDTRHLHYFIFSILLQISLDKNFSFTSNTYTLIKYFHVVNKYPSSIRLIKATFLPNVKSSFFHFLRI